MKTIEEKECDTIGGPLKKKRPKPFKDITKRKMTLLYLKKEMTIKEIAKMLNKSQKYVLLRLIKWNISRRIAARRPEDSINFTTKDIEILNGCLLGDGGLGILQKNARLNYCSSQKEHVNLLKNSIEHLIPESFKKPIKYSYWSNKYNKQLTHWIIYSKQNLTFSKLHKKWYPYGKKIVPRDIKITPTSLLWWYIGDGSNIQRKNGQQYIELYTNNFSTNEVKDILIPKLSKFEARMNYRISKKQKKQPIIYIPRKKLIKFLEYIGDCPLKCYKYKWNIFSKTKELYSSL